MKYQTLDLSPEAYDSFVSRHPQGEAMQLTPWGELKSNGGWTYDYMALGRDDEPLAAALILYRSIGPFTLAYAPRGPVVDLEDQDLFKAILELMQKKAKEKGAFVLKVDPDTAADDQATMELMTSLGFRHRGWDKTFGYNVQPRFGAITYLTDEPMDEQLKRFQSRTRTNIRRSLKNGLFVELAPPSKLSIFDDLMETTADRDVFTARPLAYFENLYEAFATARTETIDVQFFLIGLDIEEALASTYKDIKQRGKEIKRLEKKIAKADEENPGQVQQLEQLKRSYAKLEEDRRHFEPLVKQDSDNKIYLSGAIYLQSGNHAYYLYGASSNKHRDLLPNYFMQWKMMNYAYDHGARLYDFGGISGQDDLDPEEDQAPGLWEFKKRFDATRVERIGEFDCVLKPFQYKLYRIFMNYKAKQRKKRHAKAAKEAEA